MEEIEELNHPTLVAVWPGMGHVALNAGYYLMSKLGMSLEAELAAGELFEINHVEVRKGIIRPGRLPRSRFFVWRDPLGRQDLIVFLGEAQPPTGVSSYCRHIIDYAQALGVERVFTFAALATQMELGQKSRVFAAATDELSLARCRGLGMGVLQDGQIGGLNGVLLGVAAGSGLPGTCLLGEMPSMFAQVPYPGASLAVLESFRTLTRFDLDLDEMAGQAKAMEEKLRVLMGRVQDAVQPGVPKETEQGSEEGAFGPPLDPEKSEKPTLAPEERQRLEELFARAADHRSQAYQLKQELDRLEVFEDYEDRFLDLFKTPGNEGDDQDRKESAA